MTSLKSKKFQINSELEMKALGRKLATLLPSGSVVLLEGDLGVGKTTLVRGIAEGLNIKETVQSPTFNIMKVYFKGDRPLIHIDAYRLEDKNADIGLEEYIGYESGITVIEWAKFIANSLPNDVISIEITNLGENKRDVVISTSEEKLLEAF